MFAIHGSPETSTSDSAGLSACRSEPELYQKMSRHLAGGESGLDDVVAVRPAGARLDLERDVRVERRVGVGQRLGAGLGGLGVVDQVGQRDRLGGGAGGSARRGDRRRARTAPRWAMLRRTRRSTPTARGLSRPSRRDAPLGSCRSHGCLLPCVPPRHVPSIGRRALPPRDDAVHACPSRAPTTGRPASAGCLPGRPGRAVLIAVVTRPMAPGPSTRPRRLACERAHHRRRAPRRRSRRPSGRAVPQNEANAARPHFVLSTMAMTSRAASAMARLIWASSTVASLSPVSSVNAGRAEERLLDVDPFEDAVADLADDRQRLPADEAAGHQRRRSRVSRRARRRCAGRW